MDCNSSFSPEAWPGAGALRARRTHARVLSTLGFILFFAASCEGQAAGLPPVQAYVAFDGMFSEPHQRSIPVHARPGGPALGKLELVQGCDREGCSPAPLIALSSGDTDRSEVHGPGLVRLVVRHRPRRADNGLSWIRLDSVRGAVWFRVPAHRVLPYESLVRVVEEPSVWCTQPGRCTRTTYSVAFEMRRAAATRGDCASPYRVLDRIGQGPGGYYHLVLAPGVQTWLPAEVFVPMRDARGEHTGAPAELEC